MSRERRGLGYWEVTAIGIGGMVGGGIFAVLGLSVHLAGGGAPLAFLIAGVVALVTAYSYTRLSVTFPSQGGTVSFLDRAFGSGVATGSLNILLWISYMVMLSLYAYAFGSYGASLFPAESQHFWKHALITCCIAAIAGLNLMRAGLIGRAEDWIVLMKLVILSLFVAVGFGGIDSARLAPATWSAPVSLIAGGMIIFLAYEGFELIANTAHDVRDPQNTLPRAYYSAVGFVILLYVLVAMVTVGSLPVSQIVDAKDYALAEAARPAFGQAGFLLIAVTAMLSTASAINATLYGAARLSYVIAKDGELPEVLEHKVWGRPVEGLLITAVVALVIANIADLSSLSTMGSAGFLLIFAAVNGANAVLARETNSRISIALLGLVLCLGALGALLWQTWESGPDQLGVLFAMVGISVSVEVIFRTAKDRKLHLSKPRS